MQFAFIPYVWYYNINKRDNKLPLKEVNTMSKTAKRKTYEIWYNNELIDSTEDQTEALYLLNEYKLAFHSNEVILQINFIK